MARSASFLGLYQSYGSSFFPLVLLRGPYNDGKSRTRIIYSTDWEMMANKMFVTWLLFSDIDRRTSALTVIWQVLEKERFYGLTKTKHISKALKWNKNTKAPFWKNIMRSKLSSQKVFRRMRFRWNIDTKWISLKWTFFFKIFVN